MKPLQASAFPALFRKHFALGQLLLGWGQRRVPPRPIGFHAGPQARTRRAGAKQALWQENKQGHGLVVAPTGSGKSVNSLVPHLLTWPGSLVMVDPKGDHAAITARYRREVFGQRTVLADPFGCYTSTPDSLNPLDARKFSGDSLADFAAAATFLLHPDHPKGTSATEGYWQDSSDALLTSILLHILSSPAEEGNRSFPRLWDFLMGDDPVYRLATLLDAEGKSMPKMAYGQIANFLSTTDVTRSGILSTAQQHLRLLADPAMVASLARTSFDLDAFQRGEPMTIYLILPPTRLVSHGLLLRSWLATLFTVAMSRTRMPALPTLFLVDEVAALGPMEQLRTAFTLLRGYGIRVFLYLQGLEQLKRLYPQDWEIFVHNADIIQTFGVSNHLMARQFAEVFGRVSAEELLAMDRDEQCILFHGGRVERCRKVNYLKDRLFRGRFDDNPRYAAAR